MSDHQRIERQSAAMHKVIAARIRNGDETPIARARSNLIRWQRQFGGTLPAAYLEWQVLLAADIGEVLKVLENPDQDAIRRRSSSPFTGILTPRERWEILRNAA